MHTQLISMGGGDMVLSHDNQYNFEEIVHTCDNQLVLLNHALVNPELLIANESFLKNIFISITDTLFHIGNNFKTMFKIYRDFKRSELRYYLESNPVRTNDVLDIPFNEILFMVVPVPRGMTTGYMEACITTDTYLEIVDMPMKVKMADEFVRQLLKDIKSGNTKNVPVAATKHVYMFTGKESDKWFNLINKTFINKTTNEVKLGTVYKSVQDIKDVNTKLLDMEKHLIGVSRIFSYLNDISANVDDILKMLDTEDIRNKFSPNDLIKFAESIRVMAVLFERYGLVINDVNRLNHNQVEVLEKIRKHKNR